MQPLHEKGPYGDAMADDHQLIDAFLVVITVKSAERLVNADGDVEPTLAQRHSRPELAFKLDLLVVVCGLVREHVGQLFFRDDVEQAELLLDQIDVLPAIKIKFVAMTGIGLRRHRLDAADDLIGGLSRSCIRRDPESSFGVGCIVVPEILAKPFARGVRLLPSHLGERYRMVG